MFDHLSSNSAVINELEIYDENNNKIEYTTKDTYDSVTGSIPSYWNATSYWYASNLYDNKIAYTSNDEGGQNCTLFLFLSQANTNNWSRFLIDLGEEKKINNIKMAIGGSDGRTPKSISTYIIQSKNYISGTLENSTYERNIKNRNNDKLILTHTENFNNTNYTPTWYNFIE